MLKRKTIGSPWTTALLAGAVTLAAPAVAAPGGNGGYSTQPTFNTGFGDNCAVWDANQVFYLDYTCTYHDTLKVDANGTPLLSMYWDHGTLPAGGAIPKSEQTYENDFSYQPDVGPPLYVQCTQRLQPTGSYKTTCYFNQQTQKVVTR